MFNLKAEYKETESLHPQYCELAVLHTLTLLHWKCELYGLCYLRKCEFGISS